MTPGGEERGPVDAAASPVKTHVTLAVGLVICGVAFWIEVRRALGGNELSWAYVFEWPMLAVFAVYMWWRILHPARQREKRPVAPEFESMLKAWEEHRDRLAGDAATDDPPPGAR